MAQSDRHGEISTLILDMDGTLLDLHFDDQVWNHALPRALAARQRSALPEAKTHVVATLNTARGTLAWYCMDHWSREFGLSLHDIENELAHLIGVRDGTLEFLTFGHASRSRCVLATNAHPASLQRKLVRTGLAPYFDQIVSAHEFGVPKEDPRFWTEFTAQTQIEPSTAVLVDDNSAVLATAREFGIRHVFGVRYPSSSGSLKHYPAFASVNALDELLPWLRTRGV